MTSTRPTGGDGAPPRDHLAPPERFTVELAPDGALTRVIPCGELDLATVPALERAVQRAVDGGAATVVLDLRRLGFVDSTGLRLILEQTRRPDATVQVIDGANPVARLFDLTGLRDVLPFVPPPDGDPER